jgi:hypothetical protein
MEVSPAEEAQPQPTHHEQLALQILSQIQQTAVAAAQRQAAVDNYNWQTMNQQVKAAAMEELRTMAEKLASTQAEADRLVKELKAAATAKATEAAQTVDAIKKKQIHLHIIKGKKRGKEDIEMTTPDSKKPPPPPPPAEVKKDIKTMQ